MHNMRTFDAVSRDIVQRWLHPLVPDANALPRGAAPPPSYSYHRRNFYKEEGVSVARSAEIGADTVLGSGTVVGELALVRKSVVGRGCRIGMRACVDGCHLHANVTIGDHVQAHGAIICEARCSHPLYHPLSHPWSSSSRLSLTSMKTGSAPNCWMALHIGAHSQMVAQLLCSIQPEALTRGALFGTRRALWCTQGR